MRMVSIVCLHGHANHINPLPLALNPSSQQVIKARCNKDLGIMDAAQELGHEVCKDTLVVKEHLNI